MKDADSDRQRSRRVGVKDYTDCRWVGPGRVRLSSGAPFRAAAASISPALAKGVYIQYNKRIWLSPTYLAL